MDDTFTILMPFLAVTAVIAGAYWMVRWLAKSQGIRSAGRHIQVLERVMLSKDTCLALVRVGSRIYLASVSAAKVELIREMDRQELPDLDAKRPGGDFFGILLKSMGKGKQDPNHQENGKEQDGAAND